MNNKKVKYFCIIVVCLLIFGVGAVIGVFLWGRWYTRPQQSRPLIGREVSFDKKTEWRYINPLLDCGDLDSVSNNNILQIQDHINKLVTARKKSGDITDASVYFRDLNNGPWFGVNEKESFAPASLLKVPLMISVFAEADKNPSILKRTFKYKGESYNQEYFKASEELRKDRDYSVADALGYMIKYSDNNAYFVLYNVMSSTISHTYTYLGIPMPDKIDYSIGSRTYASFFRILYNSTFLSRENSEWALALLTQTEFDRGLVVGVPKSVTVAHKFGEHQIASGEKYLHDCGIVYEESTPYILCVMTKGSNFEQMADVIADVSRAVYEGVRGGVK